MPVLMQLERWPRTRKTPQLIRDELKRSYRTIMWPAIERDFKQVVTGWKDKPTFYYKMSVSGRLYRFEVKVDARTTGGKHFVWVDKGTAAHGDPHGSPKYLIEAKKAPFLVFTTPYQPKTVPQDGLYYDPSGPTMHHKRKKLMHPGIKPRNFSETILKKYKDRSNSQGFYLVTKNAYRRAFRRIPKG